MRGIGIASSITNCLQAIDSSKPVAVCNRTEDHNLVAGGTHYILMPNGIPCASNNQ